MKILVTGGSGYIGTHTIVELIHAGHEVIAIDNLSNSKKEAIKRVGEIVDRDIEFIEGDVCDKDFLRSVFSNNKIDGVIHFAGLKSVNESVDSPLGYYSNNLDSTISLCEVMAEHNVKRLIFSSSATVYGVPSELPLKETSRTGIGISNPYGQTKYMCEQILKDLCFSDREWKISILRYFNPVGAHESGLIGEDPEKPNNLVPYISWVAVGRLDKLSVFGDDYDTRDGSGVRDYIHVVDLAKGHLAALNAIENNEGAEVFNLGTGRGYSVFEVVKAFEKASGVKIPLEIKPRRNGDVAECYADSSKANRLLKWKAEKGIEDACNDSWRWQSKNPKGF